MTILRLHTTPVLDFWYSNRYCQGHGCCVGGDMVIFGKSENFNWTGNFPEIQKKNQNFLENNFEKVYLFLNFGPVKKFSQKQVNHLRLGYQPPMQEIGPDPIRIQFAFKVKDKSGKESPINFFNILVKPVDNQKPVMTPKVRVQKNIVILLENSENFLNFSKSSNKFGECLDLLGFSKIFFFRIFF